MAAAVVQPLNPLVWLGLPALVSAAATLVFAAPIEIAGFGLPQPVFAMTCAFAWAVIRPSILAPFALVVLGLFDDLLWGDRLGLWAIALLSAYALTASSRRLILGQGFWALWGWYLAAGAAAFLVAAVLSLLTADRFPDVLGTGVAFAATGAVFWFAWKLIDIYDDADVRFR
jgi:rod shape-determining protein MreD